MPVIPSPTAIHHLMFYLRMFKNFFILWLICRVTVYALTVLMLILAIKYAAYLPDNPKYRRAYDDIKVEPSNPFTSPPKTYNTVKDTTHGR